jgi:hypothetical protein
MTLVIVSKLSPPYRSPKNSTISHLHIQIIKHILISDLPSGHFSRHFQSRLTEHAMLCVQCDYVSRGGRVGLYSQSNSGVAGPDQPEAWHRSQEARSGSAKLAIGKRKRVLPLVQQPHSKARLLAHRWVRTAVCRSALSGDKQIWIISSWVYFAILSVLRLQRRIVTLLVPATERGYFVASWWHTPLRNPSKVTIDQ